MDKTYPDFAYHSGRSEADAIKHYRHARIIHAILQQQLVVDSEIHSPAFILRTTEDYAIKVRPMLFNFRLFVSHPGELGNDIHGFCYFGRDMMALVRAIDAGTQWRDPINTLPEGFDKQAF